MGIRKPSVSMIPAERIARVTSGLVAVLAAVTLFQDASSPAAVVLKGLVALAGLDLVITGALGHGPLYNTAGPVATSPERRRGATAADDGPRPLAWRDDRPRPRTTSDYPTDEPDAWADGDFLSDVEGRAQVLLAVSTLMLFVVLALAGTGVWGLGAIVYGLLAVAVMAVVMLPLSGNRG